MTSDNDAARYGDAFADVYDAWYGDGESVASSDVASTVSFLAEQAHGGSVLELGIGTGRLALPLAAAGVPVVGVDASPLMLAEFASKPGADSIATYCADMAEDLPPGPFALVFIAINTFFNLTSRTRQVACMKQVAQRLTTHGRFVIEAFVPDLDRYGPGLSLRSVDLDGAVLAASSVDAKKQLITVQYIELRDQVLPRLRSFQVCFQTPSQLDAIAAEGGLSVVERWADWTSTPYSSESSHHVSVYQRNEMNRIEVS